MQLQQRWPTQFVRESIDVIGFRATGPAVYQDGPSLLQQPEEHSLFKLWAKPFIGIFANAKAYRDVSFPGLRMRGQIGARMSYAEDFGQPFRR